jgi:hypothetical protein
MSHETVESPEHDPRLSCLLFLENELQDPYQDLPCLFILLGYLGLEADPTSPRVPHTDVVFVGAVTAFLTVALRWISAPRTVAEMNYLCHLQCQCPNDLASADEFHARGERLLLQSGRINPFPLFHFLLSNIVHSWISYHSKDNFSSRDHISLLTHKRTVWPTRLEHILPHGPEDTLRSLIWWLKSNLGSTNGGTIMQLLLTIIAPTHPITLPFIVASPTFVTHGIIQTLNTLCDWFSGDRTAIPQCYNEDVVVKLLSTCILLARAVLTEWSDEAQRRSLTGKHAAQLLLAYDRAFNTSDLIRSFNEATAERMWGDLVSLSGSLLYDFRDLAHSAPATRTKYLDRVFKGLGKPDMWMRMIRALNHASRSDRCSAPTCMKTMADVGRLRLCSGCRRVAYCGRACQKDDWSYGAEGWLPHREWCEWLRDVCTQYELPRRNVGARLMTPPATECAPEVGSWVADYFLCNGEYKIATCRMYASIPTSNAN